MRNDVCHPERAQRARCHPEQAKRAGCHPERAQRVEGSALTAPYVEMIRRLNRWNDEGSAWSRRHVVAMRTYFVYILANRSRGLYIGVTNDIARRLAQHRIATTSFSGRYRCTRLVFVESTPDVRAAIAREKQLKSWRREKKIALIESVNPAWDDLSADPSTRSARSG